MTLDKLLECNASQLEAMTDSELLKHFEQYLNVTRPDKVRANKPQQKTEPAPYISPGKRRSIEALAAMGIDSDLLFKKRKK